MNRKRCSRCKLEKPIADFHRDKSTKDGLARRCKPCAADHIREMKVKHGDKMRAARNARHKERMANDAAYADRVRRRAREAKRRLRAQNREKHNRQRRESYYRLRNDPDRWAEFLAKKRAYWQHLKKNDREKYEAALEARRITNRLRRIENGLPVWEPKRFKENEKATVSALPLRPLIDQWERTFRLERAKDGIEVPAIRTLAERAGVSDRLIYRIRNEHDRVSLDAADKLCHAIGVHFGFVYMDEESEGNDE